MLKKVTSQIIDVLRGSFSLLEVSRVNSFDTEILNQNFNNSIRLMLASRSINKESYQPLYVINLRYAIQVSHSSSIEDDYQPLDLVDRILSCLIEFKLNGYVLRNAVFEDRPLNRAENGNYLHEILYSFDIHLDAECLNDLISGKEELPIPAFTNMDLRFENILVEE